MDTNHSSWLLMAALLSCACTAGPVFAAKVRPSYCAGTWYPGDAQQLREQIDQMMSDANAPPVTGKPLAVIAPHAGYRYSAPVAAAAYSTLRGQKYDRVIVLAFSHRNAGRYEGIEVPKELTAYQTPLGDVPIDREACDRLLAAPVFLSDPSVDAGEHSLELQLPLLQRAVGDFKLVPMLVGRLSPEQCTQAATAIAPLLDDNTLLVASSDFTHYGPNYGYVPFTDNAEANLKKLAEQAAAPLLRGDVDGFLEHLQDTRDTICGRGPITLLLRTLSMKGGAEAVRTAFDTSGHMTGDWTNSVTYQSFVFTHKKGTINEQDRATLLRIARETAAAYLANREVKTPDASALSAKLTEPGACFVTLQNHGRLRGCIGNMTAVGPLYESVVHNAVAACQDPRFLDNPITAAELGSIHIEISYLTPMQRVHDTKDIIVGRHGLLISMGPRRGVLLPQVAYERGWTRDEFLAQTCRKAGLPLDTWKNPDAEIYSFEAEVFGEPEAKGTDKP